MRPVFQTVTDHNPEEGRFGDCMSACVASIFELPLASVPRLDAGVTGPDGHHQSIALSEWCLARGFQFMWVALPDHGLDHWGALLGANGASIVHILSGRSPRGHSHACVGANGRVVHDPHPDGGGVSAEDGLYLLGLFLPIEPVLRSHHGLVTPNRRRMHSLAEELWLRRAQPEAA